MLNWSRDQPWEFPSCWLSDLLHSWNHEEWVQEVGLRNVHGLKLANVWHLVMHLVLFKQQLHEKCWFLFLDCSKVSAGTPLGQWVASPLLSGAQFSQLLFLTASPSLNRPQNAGGCQGFPLLSAIRLPSPWFVKTFLKTKFDHLLTSICDFPTALDSIFVDVVLLARHTNVHPKSVVSFILYYL